MNFQKTFILGRVSHTPELKALPNGGKVATFSMATNRYWKDQSGQQQEAVEWHNIVAYGKSADLIGQYVQGGQVLFIEGRNQTRSWDDQNGGSKRYRTEIVVDSFQFGPKAANRESAAGDNVDTDQEEKTPVKTGGYEGPLADRIDYGDANINVDDIPF